MSWRKQIEKEAAPRRAEGVACQWIEYVAVGLSGTGLWRVLVKSPSPSYFASEFCKKKSRPLETWGCTGLEL